MDKLQPEQTHSDLKILANIIETLPGEIQVTLRGALNQLNDLLNHRRRTMKLVQEALDQLCVDVKYLMFDLEATRRERDELKRELGK